MWVIPLLAVVLILAAILLLWQARRRQKASGLPSGRIIYSDTHAWGPVEAPLYDDELFLTGKPDYLMNGKDGIIPVEVKSSRVGTSPYDSHIFQLAAYCRLVEANFGKRPRYGISELPGPDFRRRLHPRPGGQPESPAGRAAPRWSHGSLSPQGDCALAQQSRALPRLWITRRFAIRRYDRVK